MQKFEGCVCRILGGFGFFFWRGVFIICTNKQGKEQGKNRRGKGEPARDIVFIHN